MEDQSAAALWLLMASMCICLFVGLV
jgi:hypothetical protein